MFITLEGPNGVGKSTVISAVSEKLSDLDFEVLLTKEPTKSRLGDFLKNSEESYKGKSLACLAAADRYFHIEDEVLPALSEGKLVISDRYVESSLVLQRLDGCALEFIWDLNSQMLIPDLSIILVAKPLTISQRLAARGSHLVDLREQKQEKRNCVSTLKQANSYYDGGSTFLSLVMNQLPSIIS